MIEREDKNIKQVVKQFNKSDVIKEISDLIYMEEVDINLVLDAFFGAIKRHVRDGNQVAIGEFGRFYKRTIPPRLRQDIATKKRVETRAYDKVVFKPYKSFLDNDDKNVKEDK